MQRRKKTESIPKEDQTLINKAFDPSITGQKLVMDVKGKLIKPETGIVNKEGYVIKSFVGRTIKHNKWVIPKGTKTKILVAKQGQLYADVPEESRNRVRWSESDFI